MVVRVSPLPHVWNEACPELRMPCALHRRSAVSRSAARIQDRRCATAYEDAPLLAPRRHIKGRTPLICVRLLSTIRRISFYSLSGPLPSEPQRVGTTVPALPAHMQDALVQCHAQLCSRGCDNVILIALAASRCFSFSGVQVRPWGDLG